MPYTNGDGTYHDSRTCRRLHRTGNRIRRIDDVGDRDACEHCADGGASITVEEVEAIGDEVIAEHLDRGECPWCHDYDGEHVGRHASAAHPEAWADYQEVNQ